MTIVESIPELVLAADATLGECPGWDVQTGTLLWIDIFEQVAHRWDPVTGVDRAMAVGQDVGAVVRAADGSLVCALRDGVVRIDEATGATARIAPIEAQLLGNRANDGKVDRAGRLWVGTIADDVQPGAAGLYRLEIDGTVTPVLQGLTIANGLDWSPDDRLMYFIDSASQRIDVFDFDAWTGDIRNRRAFAEIPATCGMPDGLCVDATGGVWVALWEGWAIRHYARDGRLLHTYEFPVSHVTSLAFGGPELRDLYVTTAWVDRHGRRRPAQKQAEPLAGGLFRLRPGPAGQPPNVYGQRGA